MSGRQEQCEDNNRVDNGKKKFLMEHSTVSSCGQRIISSNLSSVAVAVVQKEGCSSRMLPTVADSQTEEHTDKG